MGIYNKYIHKETNMSCLANQELLETLFEEAYEEVSKNNLFNLDEDGIRFNAECIAQQRFEDMAQ